MTKRQMFDYLASTGVVFVHVDATRTGVSVPEYLRVQTLCLSVGWHLPRPIQNLCVDDIGIRGGFSFSGRVIPCEVPWAAVYAMRQEVFSAAWADSVPGVPQPDPKPEPPKPTRHLRSV